MTEEARTTVAVFDADSPPALALARALGRAGVGVDVYSHTWLPAARLSRFASRFHRCPDPADPRAFRPWLQRAVREGRITLVAPTSDMMAYHIAEILEDFPPPMRRAFAPRQAVLAALFKDRFAESCARAAIPTPRTAAPRSLDEAVLAARDLEYPLVIKPRTHVGLGGVRGHVVAHERGLRAAYAPLPPEAADATVFEQCPDIRWPLLQEYIPGARDGLFSVSGMIAPGGRVLAAVASRKREQWPPALGIGTYFESWGDESLIARGVDIAQRLVGRGLFELELIRDSRSGELLALDLNPRAYGQIAFEVARGVNLPCLWYRAAMGESMAAVGPAETPNMVWLSPVLFHIGQIVGLARGPDRRRRLAEYASFLGPKGVYAGIDRGDPVASIVNLTSMLRRTPTITRASLAPDPR